jgi:hypothetical protein
VVLIASNGLVGKTRRDKWRNSRIRETLYQWYGHVVRMQDYRKSKQAMEARREKRKDFSRFEKTGLR